MRAPTLLVTAASLLACTGLGDDSADPEDPQPTDVLFVVDSSGSMKEELSGLALAFEVFLDATGGADLQLAITTTSANYASGATAGIDGGEAGTLTGDEPVVAGTDGAAATAFRTNLVCDTVYWRDSDLSSDPGYAANDDGSCPLPEGSDLPREYLECLCPGGWVDSEGAGNEEGIEAALDTICRASADPSPLCWDDDGDDTTDPGYPIVPGDAGSIRDFIRPDARTVVVIVSDEGDSSRRVPDSDADIEPYVEIFGDFPNPVHVAVIGPAYHDNDGSCLDGAQTWGVERYQSLATATRGAYLDLTDQDNGCSASDWDQTLSTLGGLLRE